MAIDYTQLITSEHHDKPKFAATVALLAGAFDQVGDAGAKLIGDFNLDIAIGKQLDTIGLWGGIGRKQTMPIAEIFFTWDDSDLGWNFGSWKGPYESSSGVTMLDDDTYRAILKAKIGANYWDGSNEQLNAIGNQALSDVGVSCFALDNFDMSITIYILGAPTAVVLEMIKRGLIPPKPAGVRVTGYILASTAGAPFFALSVPTTAEVAGLDFGSFGAPI